MTPSESTRLVAMLKAGFPRQHLEQDTIALYAAFLADIDRYPGEEAVRTAIATCKFFPTIAEIRDLAARKSASLPDATLAWSEVTRAFGSVGRYREPRFSHLAIDRVVGAMGWQYMCDSENIEATRAHFLRLYADTRDTVVRDANVRPMLEAVEERWVLSRSGEVLPLGAVVKQPPGAK